MRLLSKEEQQFCQKILDGAAKNNFFENIIDQYLDAVRVSINRDSKEVNLLFQIQKQTPSNEETRRIIKESLPFISNKIITLVNLINMLEKDGYVFLLQQIAKPNTPLEFGKGAVNLPSVLYHFPDPKITELLAEYTKKEIIITEEFNRFCNSGFIDRAEQQHQVTYQITQKSLEATQKSLEATQKSLKLTMWSLIVMVIALIVAIITFIYPLVNKDEPQITSKQIENIEQNIKDINSTITRYESELVQIETKTLEELKKQNSQKLKKPQKNHSAKSK